jgi:hypothetical protein
VNTPDAGYADIGITSTSSSARSGWCGLRALDQPDTIGQTVGIAN